MADKERQPLSRLEVLRGLNISTWEGVWSTVHAVLTGGAFQTGFALLLGASPFALGLLAGLPAAVGLLQLPASVVSARRGERRRFVASLSLPGRLLWVLILLLPFVLPRPAQLPAFLVLLTISSALLTSVVPAWTSWMSDLVPAGSRGQYFARRNMVASVFTMLVPIPAAAFLDQAVKYNRFDPRVGFAVLFGVACFAAVGAFVMILRQPEPPSPPRPDTQNPLRSLAAPLADRNFRRFLLFAGVTVIGQTIAGPFFTAWQVEKHFLALPYLLVQILGAVSAGAGLLSTPFWGYLSDKYGSRPVLALACGGVVIAPILWAFTIPSPEALWYNVGVIVLLNLLSGGFWAGVGLAQFNLLLGVAPQTERATYTAVFSAVTGTLGGLSPVVGGVLLEVLRPVSLASGPLTLNNYKLLFILAGLIRIGGVVLAGRISDGESRSARYVLEQLAGTRTVSSLRSLRRLSQPVGEEERLEAVDKLGDLRSPLAVEELVTALSDVSPDVREGAAQALGAIGDARALPALIAALNDPAAGIGELAADALGRIGNSDAGDALAHAASGPDARVRVAALRALGNLPSAAKENPAVGRAFLDALTPAHPTACEAACAALTAVGSSLPDAALQEALPRLLYLLSPEVDRGMRLASARALESLAERIARFPDATEIFDTLRIRLAQETDPAVKAQKAGVLASLGRITHRDPHALTDALLTVLTHPSVRGLAYKQALLAVADVGLGPGVFYPYLGMPEMARDQTFHRLLTETLRRRKGDGAPLLEAYTSGDYADALRRLAALANKNDAGMARTVLQTLAGSADSRLVRAEEALLGVLLLREVFAPAPGPSPRSVERGA